MEPKEQSTPAEVCPRCLGSGFLIAEDGHEHSCACRRQRNLRVALDQYPDLRNVTKLDGLVERTDGRVRPLCGNAIIRSSWPEFCGHLVGWLTAAHLCGRRPRLLLTADTEIRARWLGRDPEAERHRPSSTLDVLRPYDLVVVRLYPIKHQATPRALLEATVHAAILWLVHEPGDTFGHGHPSWCEELDTQTAGFQRIDLGAQMPKGSIDDLLGVTP